MNNRFACVRVSGNREFWARDNVLNMEGNIEWFVKHADALLKQARREERERIIGWLSDDDLEKVITVQQAIDEIRAIPEKPLQQIDTNVKELPQTAPSEHQVSTPHDAALQSLTEDAEDMGAYLAPSPDWEGFGRAVMDAWPHGGLDGAELQDYAEYFGLLRKEPGGYDPEKHGVDPSGWWPDPEPGEEWWVPTYPVKRRSTVHDVGQTHSEPMQADENANGTTSEKEPKPCPFCGLPMQRAALAREWMHPDVDDCVLWRLKVYDEDVPLWNRRAPTQKARIRKLEPLREEPDTLDELSDDDVPLWNRCAPSWREEGNEQS